MAAGFGNQPAAMECPVCYSADAKLTTRCGHSFCFDCVKKWLVSSNEEGKPTCPMCRTTLHFKGIQKIQWALEEERYERACSELLDEIIVHAFETMQVSTQMVPVFGPVFQKLAVTVLKEEEETLRVMKEIDGANPDFISEMISDGVTLKYRSEQRYLRRYEWKQRDKFAAKHERMRVKHGHR